jgi:hypothetical protein
MDLAHNVILLYRSENTECPILSFHLKSSTHYCSIWINALGENHIATLEYKLGYMANDSQRTCTLVVNDTAEWTSLIRLQERHIDEIYRS